MQLCVVLSLQKQTVILLGEEEIAQVYGGFLQLLSIEEYKCSWEEMVEG